jgi:hypothetical protein
LVHPFVATAGADINVRSEKNSLTLEKRKLNLLSWNMIKKLLITYVSRLKLFLPKEEKYIKNIKEESSKVVWRHDDLVNTNKAKDKAFRATYGNFKLIVRIK